MKNGTTYGKQNNHLVNSDGTYYRSDNWFHTYTS